MRELTKNVEINEETYRIHKMNALDGVCLFKFVVEKILPTMQTLETIAEVPEGSPVDTGSQIMKTISDVLASITPAELKTIMCNCLNSVDKSLAGGWAPVMRGRDWGVDDIEYDTMTCLSLCVQVIVFNFSDFFGENGLDLSRILPNTSK